MIDLTIEQPLTLREAAQLPFLRRHGRKPHISQLYRWSKAGLGGVRLETVQVGGSRCTSQEALMRFFQRLTNPAIHVEQHTTAQRRAETARAEGNLKRAGIL